jgi:hypothetical protein
VRDFVAPLSTSRGRLEHVPLLLPPSPSPSPRFAAVALTAGRLTARERPLPLSPQPSLAQMRSSPRVALAKVPPPSPSSPLAQWKSSRAGSLDSGFIVER